MIDKAWILNRIEELMKSKKWKTHNSVTEQATISPSAMSQWYTTEKSPSLKSIISICEVFDISLSEIFSLNRIEYATARENLLLDYWEDLSEENQDVVLNVAKHLPKKEIAP